MPTGLRDIVTAIVLAIAVSGLLLIAAVAVVIPAVGPVSIETGLYGTAIGMDDLNNTPIGGPNRATSAYRFRATTNAALDAFRGYIIGPTHEGYGAGTGGTFEVTVQTNGEGNAPSGTVLARTTFVPVDGLDAYRFPEPARLEAGQLYHLVFRNVDPDPENNYASLDGLFMFEPTRPRQPLFTDADWGQPLRYGNRPWEDRPNTIPILQLEYSDGQRSGMGYMESWVRIHKPISGASMIRQTFRPPKPRLVSEAFVRVIRVSGSDPLTLSIRSEAGATLASCEIPAAEVPTGEVGYHSPDYTWHGCSFAPTRLAAGSNSTLVLSAPEGTTYDTYPIRQGNAYGYDRSTFFEDGSAEFTTDGTTWEPYTQNGRAEGDLQFYLDSLNGGDASP